MTGVAADAVSVAAAGRRIDYVCERNHPTVDWSGHPRTTDLALSRDWRPGRASRWTVTRPVRMTGTASAFKVDTGSIGGSEGISWTAADGRSYRAVISISDIVGELGPATLWIDLKGSAGRSARLTCGPVSQQQIAKG